MLNFINLLSATTDLIRVSTVLCRSTVNTMIDADRETTCGALSWRPKWLQVFASKKVYVFIYSLLGVVQGMFHSYLGAVLSTLETQFSIKSKESAYIMSGKRIFVFELSKATSGLK